MYGTIEVHDVSMRSWLLRKLDVKMRKKLHWEIQSPDYDSQSEKFLTTDSEFDYPWSSSDEDESPTEKLYRPMKSKKVQKVLVDDEDDDLKQPFEYGSEPDSSSSEEMLKVGEGVIPGAGGVYSGDDDVQY